MRGGRVRARVQDGDVGERGPARGPPLRDDLGHGVRALGPGQRVHQLIEPGRGQRLPGRPGRALHRRRYTAHRSARLIRYSRSAAANSCWPANIRAMTPSRPPSARSGRTAQACSPEAASPASRGNRRASSAREVSHTGRLTVVAMPRASGRSAALLAPPLPSRAGCSRAQASSMSRSPETAQSTATAAPAADAASATRNWGSPAPGAARSITRRTRSSDRGGPAGARASAARASGCSSTSGTASPDSCWHHDDHVTRPGCPGQAAPNGPKPQTKPIVTTRILSVILAERPDLAPGEVVQTASNCRAA